VVFGNSCPVSGIRHVQVDVLVAQLSGDRPEFGDPLLQQFREFGGSTIRSGIWIGRLETIIGGFCV